MDGSIGESSGDGGASLGGGVDGPSLGGTGGGSLGGGAGGLGGAVRHNRDCRAGAPASPNDAKFSNILASTHTMLDDLLFLPQ